MRKSLLAILCIMIFWMGLIIISISCSGEYPPKNLKQKHQIEKELMRLKVALYMYYVDNKKFPSNNEGIVYGLSKTGKSPPYFNFDKTRVIRQNGNPVNSKKIQKGDKYLPPFWKGEYSYNEIVVKPKTSFFELRVILSKTYFSKETIISSFLDPLMFKPENLVYLRYRKVKQKKIVKIDYYYESSKGIVLFYLDKSDSKDNNTNGE